MGRCRLGFELVVEIELQFRFGIEVTLGYVGFEQFWITVVKMYHVVDYCLGTHQGCNSQEFDGYFILLDAGSLSHLGKQDIMERKIFFQ